MATIGIVGAQNHNKQAFGQKTDIPQKFFFGVFFDGTGNNMVPSDIAKQRRKKVKKKNGHKEDWDLHVNTELDNGANSVVDKPIEKDYITSEDKGEHIGTGRSNVAILHSCYQGMSKEERLEAERESKVYIYNIYVEGAGKEAVNDDSRLQDTSNALGSGMGNGDTGVVALVSKAIRMVRLVLDGFSHSNVGTQIYFDVFGFSRGAACARLFSYVAGRGGCEILKCEKKFKKFQAENYYKDGYMHFLDNIQGIKIHKVSFLGIYDTVSSIGLTYDDNVQDFAMFAPDESWVTETFHLCAMDEFRSHFALTDINVEKDGNVEAFIPGCHSDVGGGYQIGAEEFTLDYRDSLTSRFKIYVENPESSMRGTLVDISDNCLRLLGWGNGDEIDENSFLGAITCRREKVLAGYSNIPLTLMSWKANEKSKDKRVRFSVFPQGRFLVPQKLNYFYTLCKERLDKMSNGRTWIYPENSYISDKYRDLRHVYLHFSSSDKLFSSQSSFVHSPNITNGIICRIVYRGQKNSPAKPTYMWNY